MITREDFNKPPTGFADSVRSTPEEKEKYIGIGAVAAMFRAVLNTKPEEVKKKCETYMLQAKSARRHHEVLAEYLEKLANDTRKTKMDETGALIVLATMIGYLENYAK